MAFLLRVELPDVPGSLGALAGALGAAGADIEAIEIVEHRHDGKAVDDVLLQLPTGRMPDALITACHQLDDVRVHWISRYNAGVNLSMDLEAVERFTEDPEHAIERLVEVVPITFRTDWAMVLHDEQGDPQVRHASPTAPDLVDDATDWLKVTGSRPLDPVAVWGSTLLAGAQATSAAGGSFVLVVGRHGGPGFLDSELARLGHMMSLAASVQQG